MSPCIVLAYLIEKHTGASFDDLVEREILQPIEMRGATFRMTPDVEARIRAPS